VFLSPDALGLLVDISRAWRGPALARTRAAAETPGHPTGRHDGAAITLRLNDSLSVDYRRAGCLAGVGARLHAAELGLTIDGKARILLPGIAGTATLAILQWLNLRRMGRLPAAERGLLQSLAERIFPQSHMEMLPYFALAVTAGVCEEFLYRGFALAAIIRAGSPVWAAVVISSILFGLAHIYQGRGGSVSTMLLGALFGTARIVYHSLGPVVLWHSGVDLMAGVAGPRYLTQSLDSAPKHRNGTTVID